MDSSMTCEELEEYFHCIHNKEDLKLKPKYYIRDEVVIHNKIDDIWAIIHENVLDLSSLYSMRTTPINPPLKQLLSYAGKDLSQNFSENGVPLTYFSAHGNRIPWLGATLEPSTFPVQRVSVGDEGTTKPRLYWWNDPLYLIGKISKQERNIRIINTLTGHTAFMTVCEEDTINEIKAKYTANYNSHSGGYTWRKNIGNETGSSGRLEFNNTLTENGIFIEKLSTCEYIPALWLFYNDDFTIA